MKKILLFAAFAIAFTHAFAQADSTISLDILRAPSQAGFVLLGISPEVVETPQDPNDVLVSLRNATNNFSTLPRSYAIDIAPAWVFRSNISAASFLNQKGGDKPLPNMWQTLRVSFATNSPNQSGADSALTQMGIGFKTSILRGNKTDIDWDSSRQQLDSMRAILKNRNMAVAEYIAQKLNSDSEIKTYSDLLVATTIALAQKQDSLRQNSALATDAGFMLRQSQLEGQKATYSTYLNMRNENVRQEASKRFDDSLKTQMALFKQLAGQLRFRRYGWKLDFAGGIVLNYPTQSLDYSLLTRYGAWITGGYETKQAVNFLGVGRIMLNPNQLYLDGNDSLRNADNLDFDAGAKIEWQPQGGLSRFRMAGEGIYRTTLNNSAVEGRLRYTLNLSYAVDKNMLLNFSVGKDFNSPAQVGGNLIAALNFFVGLGGSRPVLMK